MSEVRRRSDRFGVALLWERVCARLAVPSDAEEPNLLGLGGCIQRVLRDQHRASYQAARGLNTGRHIDDVSAVDNGFLQISDLGGYHRPSVKAGLEGWYDTLASQVTVAVGLNPGLNSHHCYY